MTHHLGMTAILGFTYLDGVLMLSDTEETTSEGTKSDCDKLYRFNSPSGTVLTGRAGNAHLIDCANQELNKYFAHGMPGTPDVAVTPDLVLQGLNIFARQFFLETVGECEDTEQDIPGYFELLIAVDILKKQTLLFKMLGNRVLWLAPPRHECIGSGAHVIPPMLRDFQFVPTKETALFCGIRMMNRAKRTMPGVGGKTDSSSAEQRNDNIFWNGQHRSYRSSRGQLRGIRGKDRLHGGLTRLQGISRDRCKLRTSV
jgi:20S proteasome alpha/beta subunit